MKPVEKTVDPTEKLWHYIEQAMNVCVIGVLWLLCSLPVFTAGAAFVGAFTVFIGYFQNGRRALFKPFFEGFRRGFKTVFWLWAITLLASVLLFVDAGYYFDKSEPVYTVLGSAMLCLLAVVIMLSQYFFAVTAYYDCGFKAALKLSACYAVAAWPYTLLCGAIAVLVPILFWCLGLWQLLFFSGGIVAFANSFFMLKAFKKTVNCFIPTPRIF